MRKIQSNMCKTLHVDVPSPTISEAPAPIDAENHGLPAGLVKEIQPYWREAARDLLRPRPEVIAQLLEKVSR